MQKTLQGENPVNPRSCPLVKNQALSILEAPPRLDCLVYGPTEDIRPVTLAALLIETLSDVTRACQPIRCMCVGTWLEVRTASYPPRIDCGRGSLIQMNLVSSTSCRLQHYDCLVINTSLFPLLILYFYLLSLLHFHTDSQLRVRLKGLQQHHPHLLYNPLRLAVLYTPPTTTNATTTDCFIAETSVILNLKERSVTNS
jgi:hypothetical protein